MRAAAENEQPTEHFITLGGFLVRWAGCVFVVFATFNPTGYSYYHWIVGTGDAQLALKVAAGLALGTAYLAAVRIARVALGSSGFITGLVAATLVSIAMLSLVSPGTRFAEVVHYLHLVSVGTTLAVGVSWSHIKHRVTGQATMRILS